MSEGNLLLCIGNFYTSMMTAGCLEANDLEPPIPRLSWRNESFSSNLAPPERSKHAATVAADGSLFICGGRSGLQPLKDLWQYDAHLRSWRRLQVEGCSEFPALEGHTIVEHLGQLFIFGGTFGYPDSCETPLWIYSLEFQLCRQWLAHGEVAVPCSRRGHSAAVYRDAMIVFGGFVDLRGSVAELWSFDFTSESWHLTWSPTTHSINGPSARHGHSAVIHDLAMWVFGGMNDLAPRSDLWRWSFRIGQWSRIKFNRGPSASPNQCAALIGNRMLVIGSSGTCISPSTKLSAWGFSFDFYCWQDLSDLVLPSSLHVCSGQTLHVLEFNSRTPLLPAPPLPRPLSVTSPSLLSDEICILEDLEDDQKSEVDTSSRFAFRNPALSVSSMESCGDSGVELLLSMPSSSSSVRRDCQWCEEKEETVKRKSVLTLVGCCRRRPSNSSLVLWSADLLPTGLSNL